MFNVRVHSDVGGRERIVLRKFDREMHVPIALYRKNEACISQILIVNMKNYVGVWLGLNLGDILHETLTKCICHVMEMSLMNER